MSATERPVLQGQNGDSDELLTVADVMELLKLSDRRAARRYMVEAGAFRLDRDYRVRASRMARWVEEREARAYAVATFEGPRAPRDRRPKSTSDWRDGIGQLTR